MLLCLEIQYTPAESNVGHSHPQLSHGFGPRQSQAVLWKKRYLATEVFLGFQPRQ